MNIIGIISAVIKFITLFDKWSYIFAKWLQKNPVEEAKKAEEKHSESKKKERTSDDTSGSFGG